MNLTKLFWVAPFAGMLLASPVAQAAGPTKDQVTGLVGKGAGPTIFEGKRSDDRKIVLVADKHGFSMDYPEGGNLFRYSCGGADKVTLAGGKGNPVINCMLNDQQNKNAPASVPKHPTEIRLEWVSATEVKYEQWPDMKAKAGQTPHNPSQFQGKLTRK